MNEADRKKRREETLNMMQGRLSYLAVRCLRTLSPLNEMMLRQYAVGYHLQRALSDPTARHSLSRAVKRLQETKRKYPYLVPPRVKQLSLAL